MSLGTVGIRLATGNELDATESEDEEESQVVEDDEPPSEQQQSVNPLASVGAFLSNLFTPMGGGVEYNRVRANS